jgi:hypothetical protein
MTNRAATSRDEAYSMATRAAWNSSNLYTMVNGKDGTQTRTFANHWRRQLTAPITAAAGTAEHQAQINQRNEAAIAMIELQNSLSSSSAGNQLVINEVIASTGYTPPVGGVGDSLEQHLQKTYGTSMSSEQLRSTARVFDRESQNNSAVSGGTGAGSGPAAGSYSI